MISTREAVLSTIERSRGVRMMRPEYSAPVPEVNDLAGLFSEKALSHGAQVAAIPSPEHAPFGIEVLLQDAGAPPRLHIPAQSALRKLPWKNAPGLQLSDAAPGADDAALAAADYAIAETGTVVFLSSPEKPASWHFLPGRHFALLTPAQIRPSLEDVLAEIGSKGLPSTLNLVTGPSCTGDIEQAIEYGAHGPKHLHILLCD